jgi:hypothetical protein
MQATKKDENMKDKIERIVHAIELCQKALTEFKLPAYKQVAVGGGYLDSAIENLVEAQKELGLLSECFVEVSE